MTRALLFLALLPACVGAAAPSVASPTAPGGPAPSATAAVAPAPSKPATVASDLPEPLVPMSPEAAELRRRGIALMDAGKYDEAEQAFGQLAAMNPSNLVNGALHEAALLAVRRSQVDAAADLATRKPIVLAPAPLDAALIETVRVQGTTKVTLAKVLGRPNKITDEAAWLASNGLVVPLADLTKPAVGLPTSYGTAALTWAIQRPDQMVLHYAQRRGGIPEGPYLAVTEKAEKGVKVTSIFDGRAFLGTGAQASGVSPAFGAMTDFEWAQVRDGVLFVSNAHRGYAKDSGGKNAWITALDVKTGKLLWRSQPLVANSRSFVLHQGVIFTGYGFTAEPDFLYTLDASTGKVLAKLPVNSGPEEILEKNGKLYVRCYDTDYVFTIKDEGAIARGLDQVF